MFDQNNRALQAGDENESLPDDDSAENEQAKVIPLHREKKISAASIKKILQVLVFIYIFSISFKNLKMNNIDLGQYVKPIAAIPFYLVFAIDLISLYLIEKKEKKEKLNIGEVISQIGHTTENLANQKASSAILAFLWRSFKNFFKQVLFCMLLLIPMMLVFAIIQAILTGRLDTTATL